MAGKRGGGEGTFWKRNGRWYGKRRIGPREAVVTINASGATRAEVVESLRLKVEQHQRSLQAPVNAGATLAQYLAWWIDEELVDRVEDGTIVSTTREQYANKVKHQITPLLGHVRLGELSVMQLRQWLTTLGRQGASTNLRRHALAVLKTALERAVRYELILSNPARLIDPPRVRREKPAEVTVKTARALLQAARGDEMEAAYVLALHIPLRVGEVLGTEWDCLDLDRGLFVVRQNLVRIEGRWELHDTKKHRARRVPLPQSVVAPLRAQREAVAFDARYHLDRLCRQPADGDEQATLLHVSTLVGEAVSPLERLERTLHPWTSYAVLPLFALANAGITLDTSGLGAAVREPVTIGVVAGLVLGKPLGVLAGAAAARATGLAPLPDGVRWAHLAGVGLLAGIGFTVSLFIAGLAFPPGDLDDAARLGILIASLLAGAAGAALLTLTAHRPRDPSTPAGSHQDQPDAPASHAPPRDASTAIPDAEQSPA